MTINRKPKVEIAFDVCVDGVRTRTFIKRRVIYIDAIGKYIRNSHGGRSYIVDGHVRINSKSVKGMHGKEFVQHIALLKAGLK